MNKLILSIALVATITFVSCKKDEVNNTTYSKDSSLSCSYNGDAFKMYPAGEGKVKYTRNGGEPEILNLKNGVNFGDINCDNYKEKVDF